MRKGTLRVLVFHPMNDYTGSTRVLATVIEDEYRDQEVAVLSNFKDGGFLSELKNVKRISFWAPEFRGKWIPIITTLVSRVHLILLSLWHGWRYDVFYINTFRPDYGAIVGRLYGKKIIYHIHEKYLYPNLGQRFSEYVFNHSKAKKIFVSEYLMNKYPQLPGSDYVVKYNRLSKSFIADVKIKPISERERKNILFIGALCLSKGVDKLVPLSKALPQYSFHCVFSVEKEQIIDYFGNDLPKNLKLYPKQSNIHPFMEKADLMINLTNPVYSVETFGMTILEAMAYGIPSVVPNEGGPIELVVNGYNGYCVDTTDLGLIKVHILKAMKESEYERLCENTIKQFEKFK